MSNSSSLDSELSNIATTPLIAPVLYGILLSWALLGLLIHQAYVYYSRFTKEDPALFTFVVSGVLFFEFLVSAVLTHLAHTILITGWGHATYLDSMPWSAVALPIGSSFVAAVVQCFFAWRIWMFNRGSKGIQRLACLIPVIATLHVGCALTVAVKWVTVHNLELFESRQATEHVALTCVALVAALSADLFITTLMVTSLVRVRQESRAVRTTVSLINHLIIRAIETGAVTAIVALLELVFYVDSRMKPNTYFVIPGISIGRFYSTMLMANLNGRGHFSGANESRNGAHSISTGFEFELSANPRLEPSRRFEDSVLVTTNITIDDGLDVKGVKPGLY